jgi:hypothetical protein
MKSEAVMQERGYGQNGWKMYENIGGNGIVMLIPPEPLSWQPHFIFLLEYETLDVQEEDGKDESM